MSVILALALPPRLAASWSGFAYMLLAPVLTLNGMHDGRARARLEKSLGATV